MRRHGTPGIFQLSSSGNRAPTLTPSANIQSLTFNITSCPGAIDDMYVYGQKLVVRVDYTVTGAGGNAVNQDQLYKMIDSFRLYSPILKELYPQPRTRGVDVAFFDQWLGEGYQPAQVGRAQIPMTNATDFTGSLYYVLPLSFEFMQRAEDCGIWMPFLENGLFEVRLAANNVLNTDSASAVLKATTFTFTAWIETLPSPEAQVQTPFQFRLYEWNTAGTQMKLQGVGSPNGLEGVTPGARIAALGWYSLNTQAGLGGIANFANLNRLALPWKKQDSIDQPDAVIRAMMSLFGRRSGYQVGGGAASALHDGGRWPYVMAATPNNTFLDANLAVFPLIMPGWDSQISKFMKAPASELFFDTAWTATPNGTHRFRTLEICNYDEGFIQMLQERMGKPVSQFKAYPKMGGKQLASSVKRGKLWGLPRVLVNKANGSKAA
jgi:hypothetical protein